MAEASFVTESKSVIEMVPVTKMVQVNKGVTLHLTLEEAQLIMNIVGKATGADSGARGLCNKIYYTLKDLGFETVSPTDSLYKSFSLYFRDDSLTFIKQQIKKFQGEK